MLTTGPATGGLTFPVPLIQEAFGMAVGLSIFLITIGAVFRFGITVNLSSLDFHAIGLIIMLAGFALLLIQMFWIIRATTVTERRKTTYTDHDQHNMTSYRDTTRDDNRPPYYLGPPLDAGP